MVMEHKKVTVDAVGRINLGKDIREKMDIQNSKVDITIMDDCILIGKTANEKKIMSYKNCFNNIVKLKKENIELKKNVVSIESTLTNEILDRQYEQEDMNIRLKKLEEKKKKEIEFFS